MVWIKKLIVRYFVILFIFNYIYIYCILRSKALERVAEWFLSSFIWLPNRVQNVLLRLSMMALAVLLLQLTPLQLQQSSTTQDNSRRERSVRFCLNWRSASFSTSSQPGPRAGWEKLSLMVSSCKIPDNSVRQRSANEALSLSPMSVTRKRITAIFADKDMQLMLYI